MKNQNEKYNSKLIIFHWVNLLYVSDILIFKEFNSFEK